VKGALTINTSLKNKKTMKRSINVPFIAKLITAILLLSASFTSCKKSIAEEEEINQKDVRIVAKETPGKYDKAIHVAATDAEAAFAGAVAGSIWGPWGSAIGAVVCGAAESLKEAYKSTNGISIPPLPVNQEWTNNNNPYDYMGQRHYLLMNEAFDNQAILIDPATLSLQAENYYAFATNFTVQSGWATAAEVNQSLPWGTFNAVMEDFNTHPNESFSDYLKRLFEQGTISYAVYNVLAPYVQTLESTTDMRLFQEYSRVQENMVLESDMSSQDKLNILGTMSTARIGIGYYWRAPFL
jgi:hypothetical protein